MNMITDGKRWLTFEVAAQNQMKHHSSLAPATHSRFSGSGPFPKASVRITRATQ